MFFCYGIIAVLLLFGQIQLLMSSGGNMLRLELLGFLVLLAMSVAGFIGFSKSWGENMLFWMFLLYLANLVAIWFVKSEISVVLLVLALVGFMLSIPRGGCVAKKKEAVDVHSEVFEPEVKPIVKEVKKSELPKEEAAKPETKFTPGKYVASKSSNVYHEPKCDWAKKIHKERQLWFASKEEAWEKGYKKHDCVK